MATSRDLRMDMAAAEPVVAALTFRDTIRIDPARLSIICASRGRDEARREIRRLKTALERQRIQIGLRLELKDCAGAAVQADALAMAAGDLGLPGLREAAMNFADCARGLDPTALAATAARLCRLADAALEGFPPVADRLP